MIASWPPLYGVVIVCVFVAIGWLGYLTVKGEEARRELSRRAREDAWPTTLLWSPDEREGDR